MKILMVLESDFPPDIRVENEAASLTEAGHEVHIACYSHRRSHEVRNDLPYTVHKKFIPILVYKASVGALKSNIYFNFWRRYLNGILQSNDFDAIHIHDLPLARVGYELSRKKKIRFVLDLHENWPALLDIATHTQTMLGKLLSSGSQWRAYEKRHVLLADQVIVVVKEARDRIISMGVDPERVHVVSNTVNPEHFTFTPQPKESDTVTMIYGGGINYHRGLQTVIKSMLILPDKIPNIRLKIIGPGSYTGQLKKLAGDLKVESYITFSDRMPLEELLKEVCRSHIALIPHLKTTHTNSTIPHKLFQYMYAGIPVVASDCAPLQRIIEETATGVCFRSGDPDSFAESVEGLLSDHDLMETIPENGRKWVEQKYHWERDARILSSLYGP